MPEVHAILSPSTAHRWMRCAGSVILEEREPDISNKYADEGTLAHALAAYCLENKLPAKKVLILAHKGKGEIITPDMADNVQIYIDKIGELSAGRELLVEQGLEIGHFTGEEGAIGTGDGIIVDSNAETIGVSDLKYGMRVKVFAEENEQMMMYGMAAARQFDMLGDFKLIKLAIHQPRLDHFDEWEVTADRLKKFEAEVGDAANHVAQARKSNSLDQFLTPGKKQCKFCKAKASCSALANLVAKETGVDFDDLTPKELTAPVDLSSAMRHADMIEGWLKAVRAKVESELLSARPVPGYKLVEGKKGNRDWASDEEAETEMRSMRLKQEEMYNFNLLSPAQMEKKLKDRPAKWSRLSKLITQKQGKVSVAAESDPRPAYDPKPADDFSDLIAEEDPLAIPDFLKRKQGE